MISDIITRLTRTGIWRASDYAELPQLDHEGTGAANQLLVVAGGLALTLSRCTPAEQRQAYPNAMHLYGVLKKELRQQGKTTASAELLLDAFHETSEQLDQHSRQAFHRCLEARVCYERMNAGEREAASRRGQGMYTSHMPVSAMAMPLSEAFA
jgi:hypothetical protein